MIKRDEMRWIGISGHWKQLVQALPEASWARETLSQSFNTRLQPTWAHSQSLVNYLQAIHLHWQTFWSHQTSPPTDTCRCDCCILYYKPQRAMWCLRISLDFTLQLSVCYLYMTHETVTHLHICFYTCFNFAYTWNNGYQHGKGNKPAPKNGSKQYFSDGNKIIIKEIAFWNFSRGAFGLFRGQIWLENQPSMAWG